MAKRNRYRELENLMIKVILGNAAMLVLFLVFSRLDIVALKVITGILTVAAAALGLCWLMLTGELKRRRSLWMVTGFVCIVIVAVVSLLLGYPCPPVTG